MIRRIVFFVMLFVIAGGYSLSDLDATNGFSTDNYLSPLLAEKTIVKGVVKGADPKKYPFLKGALVKLSNKVIHKDGSAAYVTVKYVSVKDDMSFEFEDVIPGHYLLSCDRLCFSMTTNFEVTKPKVQKVTLNVQRMHGVLGRLALRKKEVGYPDKMKWAGFSKNQIQFGNGNPFSKDPRHLFAISEDGWFFVAWVYLFDGRYPAYEGVPIQAQKDNPKTPVLIVPKEGEPTQFKIICEGYQEIKKDVTCHPGKTVELGDLQLVPTE